MGVVDLKLPKELPLGANRFAAFDSDFELYALSDNEGNVSVMDVATGGDVTRLPRNGAPIWRSSFSPDRRYLTARYHRPADDRAMCRVWDLHDGRVLLDALVDHPGGAVEFGRESRWVALGKASGDVEFYRLPEATFWKRLQSDLAPHSACLHPRRGWLGVSSIRTGTVKIWDMVSDAVVRSLSHRGEAWGLAWHPGGDLLAVACDDARIRVWDFRSGGAKAAPLELLGHQSQVIDTYPLRTKRTNATSRVWLTSGAQRRGLATQEEETESRHSV